MTTSPPTWTREQLDAESQRAEAVFADERYKEPVELYGQWFDTYQSAVEDFLEQTVDLTQLDSNAAALLSDQRMRDVFRYVTGPPVSEDDLKTMMGRGTTLSRQRIESDPELVANIVKFARDWHDRRRFPWLSEGWEPQEANRQAAVLATTALLAMRRVETQRRTDGKVLQEQAVADALLAHGLEEVPTVTVGTLDKAPKPGTFCRECKLGTRKADFLIGLFDGRTMALECKVSNSTTNSVKRLTNDAAIKAESWRKDFGTRQIVPAAVLGGCYKLHNLEDAQTRGLALFWAHDLQPLIDFIAGTRPADRGSSTG